MLEGAVYLAVQFLKVISIRPLGKRVLLPKSLFGKKCKFVLVGEGCVLSTVGCVICSLLKLGL